MAASNPTNQDTSTTKGLGSVLLKIVVIVTILGTIAYLKIQWDKGRIEEKRVAIGVPQIITLSANCPSEPIRLVDRQGNLLEITYGVMSDTTPYIVHINGGEGEIGGFDIPFPARIHRPPNWKPDEFALNKAITISFELRKGYAQVPLSYTLTRK